MLRLHGGTEVKWGYYWSLARWEVVTIRKDGGRLPGEASHRYFRLPIALLLLLAPVMGGLYVVFLPFIGFFMVLRLAGRKAAEAAARGFMDVMATVSPAWRPGEAYFAGRRKAGKANHEPAAPPAGKEDPLEKILEEIEAKRAVNHE